LFLPYSWGAKADQDYSQYPRFVLPLRVR
jgi:hypothetical protein